MLAASQINNRWIEALEGRALLPDAATVARIIAEWMSSQDGEVDVVS